MTTEFTTPILFIIFNRPEETERVFEAIRSIRPERLFIAADGPRFSRTGEEDLVAAARQLVLNNIDWPCEVKTLLRSENLGCKLAVSSALGWFFENVPAGIILEDDCLPDPSFFQFCADLLERYRDDERIFMISGDNFLPASRRPESSYYFSRLPHIWGWATWRRAWKKYDVTMSSLPESIKNKSLDRIWPDKRIRNYWLNKFIEVRKNLIDTWDYQWSYAIWKNQGLSLAPTRNLVSNIGFKSGTHTANRKNKLVDLKREKMVWPLLPPADFSVLQAADDYEVKNIILRWSRLKRFLRKSGLVKIHRFIFRRG